MLGRKVIAGMFAACVAGAALLVSVPMLVAAGSVNLGYLALVHTLAENSTLGAYQLEGVRSPTEADRQRLNQARQHFDRAISLDPSVAASVQYAVGHINGMVGEVEQWSAQAGYAGARAESSALALGLFHWRNGRPALAERVWAEHGRDLADYFVHRGDRLLVSADRERALRYYQLAERLRPEDPAVSMRVTFAGIATRRDELARQKLDALLASLSPAEFADVATRLHATVSDGFVWVLIAAADVLEGRGRINDADFILGRVYRIQPDPIAFSRLGAFYCRHGRFQDGFDILERAKAYGAQHYALESRLQLSLCYCRAGQRGDAVREAEALARLAPPESEFRTWPNLLQQNWQNLCAR